MTPELKNSCEVVFQEHKTSLQPISWNKNVFHGRISIGLCEMAKETLVQKHVIYFIKPPKKTMTLLNPDVATASTFEEAIAMAQHNTGSLKKVITQQPVYSKPSVSKRSVYTNMPVPNLVSNTGNQQTAVMDDKWYLKPVFFYFVWPAAALLLSIFIAYLMTEAVEMAYHK